MSIRIHATPEALADAVADEVAGWLSIPEHRTVGLAGGSTPRRAYEHLRGRTIPWSGVHAWMTDERHVPAEHPDCNARMARHALFDHVAASLHEVPFKPSAAESAAAYEAELDHFLRRGPLGREPGLVLLGVGTDGHTASLFPDTSALDEDDRDIVAVEVPGRGWRVTATLGLLARARRTIFVVAGAHKAEIVAEVMQGASDLPAAVVARHARDPIWLLDRDAAAHL